LLLQGQALGVFLSVAARIAAQIRQSIVGATYKKGIGEVGRAARDSPGGFF